MAASPPSMSETGSKHRTYSRKQKSLGLLCSNFMSLYNRDGVDSIGLDDAANKLGVERRRIYDIVNVLESVGVLSRRAKNQYTWKGFKAIPKALAALRDEGLREKFGSSDGSKEKFKVVDYDEETCSNPDIGSQSEQLNPTTLTTTQCGSRHGGALETSNPNVIKSSASSKSDNRREKSLGLLTQNFVKLFICSNVDLISLDDAAKVLLGDGHNPLVMRTKVRRLYDIANVLSSLRLIEKTHQAETRKPAFRWLGLRERTEDSTACPPVSTETKKRTFGTEITNISFKRNKADFVGGEDAKQTKQQFKIENVESECNHSEKDIRPVSRSYQYGPFAPVTVAKVVEQKNTKPVHDLENLASTYRPQYHNQALRDLFDHYVEAWKSWYSEIAGKPPLQQVS